MRIVVLGPGALGAIFADALQRSGQDVVLLGRPSSRTAAVQERGLRLRTREGETRLISVPILTPPSVVADADVVIVLVKAGDTAAAASRIAPFLSTKTSVLTLQNGLDNARIVRETLGSNVRILSGVTSQAATRAALDLVLHTGTGPTLLGFESPIDESIARTLAGLLEQAGLPAAVVPDIDLWIWRKAAVNVAINGLTALGGFPNGQIATNPQLLDLAETLAEEAAAVARARGMELGPMREAVLKTATATASNRSSMLQDLEAGRATEVEAIHGAIQAAARTEGLATPSIDVVAGLIRARTRRTITEESLGGEVAEIASESQSASKADRR